jgi:integrase
MLQPSTALHPLSVTYRDTASLKPDPRNARTHSKRQVDQIVASIRTFGFANPILIDPDGVVIAGHGRLMAAKSIGMAEVPTIELAGLSDAHGAKLTIPLHADLRAILAETKRDHIAILTTEHGRPFTVDGFSGFMREAITAAGLPLDCQPHGLRKAAGRRLAEAGASSRELTAVLGHKTLSEAERYTRDADQARLASSAVARLEGRKVNS